MLNIMAVPLSVQYDITRAKKDYLVLHPECAFCGCQKNIEIHHIQPLHLFPNLACDFHNFISLHDNSNNSCHRWFGHLGNFSSKYNPYIREQAIINRLILQNIEKDRNFLVSTDRLIKEFAVAQKISVVEFMDRLKQFIP